MKIYLHKNGETTGPFNLEEVRQKVQNKVFSIENLACYDGKEWVRISKIPGYVITKKKTTEPPKAQELPSKTVTKKSRKKLYIFLPIICILAVICSISLYFVIMPENPYPGKGDPSSGRFYTNLSEKEFKQVVQKAINGDTDSQLELASIYKGKGMGAEPVKLPEYFKYHYKWINKAAENKNFHAKYQLANLCYTYGDPVEFGGNFNKMWDFHLTGRGSRKTGRARKLYNEVDQFLSEKSKLEKINFLGLGWIYNEKDSRTFINEIKYLKYTLPIYFSSFSKEIEYANQFINAIEINKLSITKDNYGDEILCHPNSKNRYTGKVVLGQDSLGKPNSFANYKDGRKDGLWIKWYDNGQKESEANYKNGKLHGLSTNWYENGQKKEVLNWKDGMRNGSSTEWHKDGQEIIRLRAVPRPILNPKNQPNFNKRDLNSLQNQKAKLIYHTVTLEWEKQGEELFLIGKSPSLNSKSDNDIRIQIGWKTKGTIVQESNNGLTIILKDIVRDVRNFKNQKVRVTIPMDCSHQDRLLILESCRDAGIESISFKF